MKKILCILSMLSILLVSCNKVDSSYISSIDVTIDFLRLDFNDVEKRDVNYLQVIGDELYYTVNASLDRKIGIQVKRTVSLNKVNIKTNEITLLKSFNENSSEFLESFLIKNNTMYYSLMTVSDDFEKQNPLEYNIYVETDGNSSCIDTVYIYGNGLSPILFLSNNEVFYTTVDLRIEDTILGTGQYGFKLMNVSNDEAIEIFSSYAPMIDFAFDNDLFEVMISNGTIKSGKYFIFLTMLRSEQIVYVYNTETEDLERINLGKNIDCVGMFDSKLLLLEDSEDFISLADDVVQYQLFNIETKEKKDCGNTYYLWGPSLSEQIFIGKQQMKTMSVVYIDIEEQMQLIPIKDDKTEVSSGGVLPISETSFLVENSYFDQIVELEIK